MDPKNISPAYGVNGLGHLTVGGCDTVTLAKHYGTPLYVMDETLFRQALRDYRATLSKCFVNGGAVAYASKACAFKAIYRMVQQEDCWADVVSPGEIYTALCAGFPAEHLMFHGNNKTDADIKMALECGVGRIVADHPGELRQISRIAGALGKTANILMRITPGIDAHTHSFIRTGQIDSKFGFTLENGDALRFVGEAISLPHICLTGVHCHIGSQIFDDLPFAHAAGVMLTFMYDVRRHYGVTLHELDLGGGFGIRYTESDHPLSPRAYLVRVANALKDQAEKLDFPIPFIFIEPGRSVAAPAGVTLYTVGSIKNIPGVRTYVGVDGGMTDNPRYALYGAPYTVLVAGKANLPAQEPVTVAGRCCESGDLIQENTLLQPCEPGDILAVLATGAYNYSMASNYNRFPRPAVVFTKEGAARLTVRRESLEDLVRNDLD